MEALRGWDRKVTENGLTRHRFDARLAGCINDLSTPVNMIAVGSADDLRIAGLLLGKRLTSTAGGPIAYVTAAPRCPVTAPFDSKMHEFLPGLVQVQ
ncbi:hypothetical protein AB0G05_14790 [Nonomuraea wenchangensis]